MIKTIWIAIQITAGIIAFGRVFMAHNLSMAFWIFMISNAVYLMNKYTEDE